MLGQSDLDIGEVAAYSGLPSSTLRYYEEKGLIQSIGRNGLRRCFDKSVLPRLDFIALGRHAGFSLEEIKDMFTPSGSPQINRQQLLDKAEQVNESIKQLTALRDSLQRVAECAEEDHFNCSRFQKLLRIARRQRAS